MSNLTGVTHNRAVKWVPRAPLALAAIAILAVLAVVSGLQATFPVEWQVGLAQWVDELDQWWRLNRAENVVYIGVLRPLALAVAYGLAEIQAQLELFGFPGVLVVVGTVAFVVAGRRVAAVAVAALVAIALLGQWDNAVTTLSQITVAVVAAVAIGVPIGILAGRIRAVEQVIRPVLDAMQTIPAYVYLLPLVLLFGVGNPPAIIATILYAVPPAVRLTALGIRSVPDGSIEVGNAVGATGPQLLRTVQLPQALPSIRIGVNQTIMMALSMVVIGALIGATGLGLEVLRGLQTLDIGRALDAGLAIVLLAMLVDRITYAAGARGHRTLTGVPAIGAIVVALVVGRLLGSTGLWAEVPFGGALSVAAIANQASQWASTTLYPVTSAFSDAVILFGLNPLRAALIMIPWWLLAALVAIIAARVVGGGMALFSAMALVTVGAIGVWNEAMNTFSQVAVATVISVALAIPVGIAASQSDLLGRALRPILDGMQTLPAFVYLVPVVALFNVGRVPGIIASVIYALPPAIRMTNAGIRQVPAETVEAARSQGATRWQLLRTVQLPLARPTILMGVNQTIMMVLAGIVIAGLIGAGGLGIEAIRGLTQGEIGRGVVAGLAIVLLGMVLDRITQSLGGASAEERERERATIKTA